MVSSLVLFSHIIFVMSTKMRVMYYWWMTASQMDNDDDDENGNGGGKGIVGVMYLVGMRHSVFPKANLWKFERIRNVCPVRVASAHFCYDDPMLSSIVPLAFAVLSRSTLPRLRHHYGTYTDTLLDGVSLTVLYNRV